MTSFVHETDNGAELLFELDEKTGTVSAMAYEASDLYQGLYPIAENVGEINPTTGSNRDIFLQQLGILNAFEEFLFGISLYESHNTGELCGDNIKFDCNAKFYAGYQVLLNGNEVLGFYFPNGNTQMMLVGEDVPDVVKTLCEWVNNTRHWLQKHRKDLIV